MDIARCDSAGDARNDPFPHRSTDKLLSKSCNLN